jgi:hypothetical protein
MTIRHKTALTITMLATLALAAAAPRALAHDSGIPIGDGNVSTSPKTGNVFSCRQQFNPDAGGAHAAGDWIEGDYWYPDRKPTVDGSVEWPDGGTTISVAGGTRALTSTGFPDHPTGVYPISRSDDAYQYDRNPNTITPYKVSLELPVVPQAAASPSCVPMGMIAVSLTGAAIFNALDAPGRDAAAHEILDECSGHPERTGQYHYHAPSPCMDEVGAADGHSGLIGYALDGFGIFRLAGAGGRHLTNADLDACHGHSEKVMWDGESRTIYHYHLTDEYPYTVGCFMGAPVSPGRADRAQPAGGGDPQAMLQRAAAELGVPVDALRRAVGPPPPDFRRAAQLLDISEDRIRRAMMTARQ